MFLLNLLFLSTFCLNAQMTVKENFKGNEAPNIVIGDGAYLTSGGFDEVDAGWLRLTEAKVNQKGYAYIDEAFPSTMGILVDFEYQMWRSDNDGYGGADGIGVFLFDGEIDKTTFKLGGYGGSLGYAPNTASLKKEDSTGLSGGYIGIGLDAYGNFSNPTDGKVGDTDPVPNAIVLRGPTTDDPGTTNKYLAGEVVETRYWDRLYGYISEEVDYNTLTKTRPKDEFYRRVQLELLPIETGEKTTYRITVRWAKKEGGAFEDLIVYDATEIPPPETLKIGFAASTGGGFNYHEIQNLEISTPGNLRVTKRADKDILSAAEGSNLITYTIEVVNDTDADLPSIEFMDILTDANGDVVPTDIFEITDISYSDFTHNPDLSEFRDTNELSGTLGLLANTTGKISMTGMLKQVPEGYRLNNTTSVEEPDIDDADPTNNEATVETRVNGPGVDLEINKTASEHCFNPDGNTFTIRVANVGSDDLIMGGSSSVSVTDELPGGNWKIKVLSAEGWSYNEKGESGNLSFTRKEGTLSARKGLPDIVYIVTYPDGMPLDYHSKAKVTVEGDSNQKNNTSASIGATVQPAAPVTPGQIYYFQNEDAEPLTAVAKVDNTLNWYYKEGEVRLEAIVPNTSEVGNTTYYVSQTRAGCESELTAIEVIVLAPPTPGNIGGNQEVCRNRTPEPITSGNPGVVECPASISYRWEYSLGESGDWQRVEGASEASYGPGLIAEDIRFHRISIASLNVGGEVRTRESEPTPPVLIEAKICQVSSNPMLRSGRTRSQY